MKKIVSLALMALTLCVQHESHAMANLRNYAGRIGQQCALRWNRQVTPAYRSFTTGLGQRASNLRPQISQQFRNMQTSARNWSQNLNLPTARTAALGLGGAGLTAAYLQRPEFFGVVRAEEEKLPDSNIEWYNFIDNKLQNDISLWQSPISYSSSNLSELRNINSTIDKYINTLQRMETYGDAFVKNIAIKLNRKYMQSLYDMQSKTLNQILDLSRAELEQQAAINMNEFVRLLVANTVQTNKKHIDNHNNESSLSDQHYYINYGINETIKIPRAYIKIFEKSSNLKKQSYKALTEREHMLKPLIDMPTIIANRDDLIDELRIISSIKTILANI